MNPYICEEAYGGHQKTHSISFQFISLRQDLTRSRAGLVARKLQDPPVSISYGSEFPGICLTTSGFLDGCQGFELRY